MVITLTGDVDGDGDIDVVPTSTGPNGEYWFEDLFPGDYTVTETPQPGWVPSTPTSVDITVDQLVEKVAELGQAMLTDEEIALGFVEMLDERLAFGNFETGSIHALKFKDINADGIYDPAVDQPLAGVDFILTGVDGMGDPVGPIVMTSMLDDPATAEDETGLLWFTELNPGTYTLTETMPKGLNGVMVDVARIGMPNLSFEFRVSNDNTPDDWAEAPEPTISVRPGEGEEGTDRVTIIWDDGAIQGRWLQVTAKSLHDGMPVQDVHYWGNAIGDTGNSTSDTFVNAIDSAGVRDNPHNFLNPANIDDSFDFNRDTFVNAVDSALARDYATNFLTSLKLISTPPEEEVAAAASVIPAAAGLGEFFQNSQDDEQQADADWVAIDAVFLGEPFVLPSPVTDNDPSFGLPAILTDGSQHDEDTDDDLYDLVFAEEEFVAVF